MDEAAVYSGGNPSVADSRLKESAASRSQEVGSPTAQPEGEMEEMEEQWRNNLLASVDRRTGDWKGPPTEIKPPTRVRAAHRLRSDIGAMLAMTLLDLPPH